MNSREMSEIKFAKMSSLRVSWGRGKFDNSYFKIRYKIMLSRAIPELIHLFDTTIHLWRIVYI